MPINAPTTQESVDAALVELETALNQSTDLNPKAFNRVLAGLLGMQQTAHYSFGTERAKQNLILTASGKDLEYIGAENDEFKSPAQQWSGKGLFIGTEGAVIPIGAGYYSAELDTNYITVESITIPPAGSYSGKVQAVEYGPESNLNIGDDILVIGEGVSNVQDNVQITEVTKIGADTEDQEDFRLKVLDASRAVGGGSNLADYRKWGQGVTGVKRIHPYTGISPDFSLSIPGYRTIFVLAQDDVDPDGIAPQGLLDNVRAEITVDPETGLARQSLGSVDSEMDVSSIYRSGFYFEVRGLQVSGTNLAATQVDIEAALDIYARNRTPFIWGLDADIDKNDVLSGSGAAAAAQQAALKYGGWLNSVSIGLAQGQILPPYQLQPGQYAKKQLVTYA